MGVCTECDGASKVRYDVRARCRTLLRGFKSQNRDKLKGVRFNVGISNYNGNKNRPSTRKTQQSAGKMLIISTGEYMFINVILRR